MISILTLAVLSHLAPLNMTDPPVYGPCPAHNPNTEYHLWTSNLWDQACYRIYYGAYLDAKRLYWLDIGACPPGDCDCYAAAWERFLGRMEAAENELRWCSPT